MKSNAKKWKAEYSFQSSTSEHCKVKQSCLCCSQCCSCVLTSRAAEFVAGGDNVHRWACIGYSWWHLFIAQYAHCTLCIAHTCWFGQCNIMHMVSDAERNHKLLLLVTFDWTLCTKCMYHTIVDTEYAHYALCSAIWCKEKPQSVALGDRRDGWRRQRRHHLLFSSSLSYLSSLPSLSPL